MTTYCVSGLEDNGRTSKRIRKQIQLIIILLYCKCDPSLRSNLIHYIKMHLGLIVNYGDAKLFASYKEGLQVNRN